ncbi:MAG: hypothetical protein JOY72_09650 [Actinobacteria bacterium]|nr:hypothetical protein [Actinomycetota bacterium]MBV8480555.1 hypothetical protein [Actinomycetota bacterium]
MTVPPDFDQLVGGEGDPNERARLRRVHELLVQAGPPPELSPEVEAGPTLGMTLGGRGRRGRVRTGVLLLAAAVSVLVLAFTGGYIVGNDKGGGTAASRVLQLRGTSAVPAALASLEIEPKDVAGNWPMRLIVKGLPQLAGGSYYEVFLVRDGKPYAPCGAFKVASGEVASVQLNAPYRLQPGDTWIVTRQTGDDTTPGPAVLRPV